MLSKKKIIIGLVGAPGSGKTTVSKILERKNFISITLSSFIKEYLNKKGLEINRKNLQDAGNELRREKGVSILADLALKAVKKLKARKIVIDGIRNLNEIDKLKEKRNFFLLGISATPDKRFKRLVKNFDEYKKIDTWKEFVYDELRESIGVNKKYGQQNQRCYLNSDYFLDNNSGFLTLKKKLEIILNKIY